MKITSIESCVLTVPTSKQMALEFPHHKLVVAQIATDEGLRGLGYSLVFGGGGAESVLSYLDARLKPLLLGEDPLGVERLWEKMYRGDRGVRRVGIAGMALSALDIGLWDLAGKAAKLPLYKLWGAVRDSAGYGCDCKNTDNVAWAGVRQATSVRIRSSSRRSLGRSGLAARSRSVSSAVIGAWCRRSSLVRIRRRLSRLILGGLLGSLARFVIVPISDGAV
jgi:L-alanine-DL-glutamate epimerase-like enolase superfamily enzyme